MNTEADNTSGPTPHRLRPHPTCKIARLPAEARELINECIGDNIPNNENQSTDYNRKPKPSNTGHLWTALDTCGHLWTPKKGFFFMNINDANNLLLKNTGQSGVISKGNAKNRPTTSSRFNTPTLTPKRSSKTTDVTTTRSGS